MTQHYYNIAGFLEDQEIHKIWNIIDNALERQGYNADNGELSIRVYDEHIDQLHPLVESVQDKLLGID